MASWRLAKSLNVVIRELNELVPVRNKTSDGTIGNAAHATRSSDHNPWVKDGGMGVVRARDITHHTGVFDVHVFADQMRIKARGGHPAFGQGAYIISNRRIASVTNGWVWRGYTGPNPHHLHAHFSVGLFKASYDSLESWVATPTLVIPATYRPATPLNEVDMTVIPTLRRGSRGQAVRNLQGLLNAHGAKLKIDGDFGPGTEAAVRTKQAAWHMQADGIVGPATWTAFVRG